MSKHWFEVRRIAAFSLAALLGFSLGACQNGPAPLTAEVPLHLEDHLDAAVITGSEAPSDIPEPIEWRFDEPQPDWKPAWPHEPGVEPAKLTRTEDALRVRLPKASERNGDRFGGASIELPDWQREDWAYVVVRARTSGPIEFIEVAFNCREGSEPQADGRYPLGPWGDGAHVIRDGSIQTYLLRADYSSGVWFKTWNQLGILFWADETAKDEPASIDILSVALTPKEAKYAEAPVGTGTETRGRVHRQAIHAGAPSSIEYQVRVPETARLDFALGVMRNDAPVNFRVEATADGSTAGLFEETYSDKDQWGQRSVDLSRLAGQTVTLTLSTESDRNGTVALWGAPTLTAARTSPRPNVIFYVIDGGAADFMSVYGYNRRTTPNLERLAAQGALFERVYSNSSWTRPSTASYMTSLHNSVMGGLLNWNDGVPEQAVTMAEHMHRAGYQTAVFTANPNAGTLGNLQRGVDVFREDWKDFSYTRDGNHRESSRFLHDGYWSWREQYPAEPYWVHFQTTDVHGNFPAAAPFAGRFVSVVERKTWSEWKERLKELGGRRLYSDSFEKAEIDRTAFWSLAQGLYDETMAHNDYQIGRLIERLKAAGEWQNTLLIIGGDHSAKAAMQDMGIALEDKLPPRWNQPMLRPTITRVPLIFVWPGRISPGQRFDHPVSMIDVLPTILDLAGLPPAEVSQGQSLAPLLLGRDGWEPRPVILDEFEADPQTGKFRGLIEVIDGRWGASLEINPDPDRPEDRRRPVPLLLYDLWKDPMCLESVHEKHPDLVEKYKQFLEEQYAAHRELGERFTRPEGSPMTPEQLRTLRSLGYIQ